MQFYSVKVKPDSRWQSVRVAAREFTKAGVTLQESELNDEIKNSPLLDITPVDEPALTPEPETEPNSAKPPRRGRR